MEFLSRSEGIVDGSPVNGTSRRLAVNGRKGKYAGSVNSCWATPQGHNINNPINKQNVEKTAGKGLFIIPTIKTRLGVRKQKNWIDSKRG